VAEIGLDKENAPAEGAQAVSGFFRLRT